MMTLTKEINLQDGYTRKFFSCCGYVVVVEADKNKNIYYIEARKNESEYIADITYNPISQTECKISTWSRQLDTEKKVADFIAELQIAAAVKKEIDETFINK